MILSAYLFTVPLSKNRHFTSKAIYISIEHGWFSVHVQDLNLMFVIHNVFTSVFSWTTDFFTQQLSTNKSVSVKFFKQKFQLSHPSLSIIIQLHKESIFSPSTSRMMSQFDADMLAISVKSSHGWRASSFGQEEVDRQLWPKPWTSSSDRCEDNYNNNPIISSISWYFLQKLSILIEEETIWLNV